MAQAVVFGLHAVPGENQNRPSVRCAAQGDQRDDGCSRRSKVSTASLQAERKMWKVANVSSSELSRLHHPISSRRIHPPISTSTSPSHEDIARPYSNAASSFRPAVQPHFHLRKTGATATTATAASKTVVYRQHPPPAKADLPPSMGRGVGNRIEVTPFPALPISPDRECPVCADPSPSHGNAGAVIRWRHRRKASKTPNAAICMPCSRSPSTPFFLETECPRPALSATIAHSSNTA